MSTPLGPTKQQKMARILAHMETWPRALPNLTPDFTNVVWGSGPNEMYDLYRGPGTGPRRVVTFLHFGGGTSWDHKQPALAGSGGGNALAYYLTRSPVAEAIGPTDFISLNYEQFRWDFPTPVTHIPPYVSTPNPTIMPAQRTRLLAFFNTYFPANLNTTLPGASGPNNWEINRHHGFGSSQGGVLLTLQMFLTGLPIRTLIVESPIPDYRSLIVYWQTAEGMYGDGSFAAWVARALSDKNAITELLQLGVLPATYKPMQILNAIGGNGIIPYGDPATGANFSIHDTAQWQALKTALEDILATHRAEKFERGAWQDPNLGAHQISMRTADWMIARE